MIKRFFIYLTTGSIALILWVNWPAKADESCRIEPYEVSHKTYCAIAVMAGEGGVECGGIKPERRPE